MNTDEYLRSILNGQTFADDDEELKTLRSRRAEVESLLRKHFEPSSPTIRYGGSYAKGTMIRDNYDLDIACYFANDDDSAGESIEAVFNNARTALAKKYTIQDRTCALRILGDGTVDFHVDVVPGRFVDATKGDAFLHQTSGSKTRLRTNLDTHIAHVRDSGVVDAIRLTKLWRERNGLSIVRTFVLELLVVELLKRRKSASLADQVTHVLTEFRDHSGDLAIEDPANPTGNDLSELLNDTVRGRLATAARDTLTVIEREGWEGVFGSTLAASDADKVAAINRAVSRAAVPTRPWCDCR